MDIVFPHPFDAIAPRSAGGGALLLRLRDRRGRWIRVHENGDLEAAIGDERKDTRRSPLSALALGDPLLERARALHGELLGNFRPGDLLAPSPWDHFYPVQAFAGSEGPVVEGFVGVEIEMGTLTDVLGFRSDKNGRASVQTLQDLLDRLG